jgi:transcriptional regulator with XRE-family HTH domain
VTLRSLQPRGADAAGFAELLRAQRHRRRVSQLELAVDAGVSQRHLSFLESGRARPSRAMILQLCETLEVPLRERNDWLIAAGFAPMFHTRGLDDPQMAQVMNAIRLMLTNHAPFPALAFDRAWNIRLTNAPFDMLVHTLGSDLWTRVGGNERNLLRLMFHPAGLRPFVTNWATAGPLLWQRARREADTLGGAAMKTVLDELAPFQSGDTLASEAGVLLLPVLPIEIEKDGLRVSLFTVISTFGTAQDVTADELKIELLFPADAATDSLFRQLAPP